MFAPLLELTVQKIIFIPVEIIIRILRFPAKNLSKKSGRKSQSCKHLPGRKNNSKYYSEQINS
jgi:hypothetical protein